MHTPQQALTIPGLIHRLRRALTRHRSNQAGGDLPFPLGALQPAPAPPVEVAPDASLTAYLQRHPGVVDLDHLQLDSPAVRTLQQAGVKVIVPLISQGELVGMISLGPRLSEQEYSSDDHRLLDNLASQAAPAIRVAQLVRQQAAELQERERIEQQLRLARVIQQTLLPRQVPQLPGWRLAAHYQPAWEVGGDFYDFIALPGERLGLVIGDVTDKGVPSALVMATTRSILRAAAERFESPRQVLEHVNEVLHRDIPPNMFVTCFCLVLDPARGHLRYANAGHDLPYRRTPQGVEVLRATGMPLGLMPAMAYEEQEGTLAPGESLLLYSDGLTEAHNPAGEMVGFPRVQHFVRTWPGQVALIEYLLDQLAAFTGAGWVQEDDVTLVTLERLAAGAAPARSTTMPTEERRWRTLAEFTLPSVPGNERMAIERVVRAVRSLDLPARRLERLKTAVGEAVMNATEHGNRYQPDLPVGLVVRVSDTAVSVRVSDQGGGQPIPEPSVPDLAAKLAGAESPRGWGLFLMQHMVDELTLITEGSQHITELILYRKGDDSADPDV